MFIRRTYMTLMVDGTPQAKELLRPFALQVHMGNLWSIYVIILHLILAKHQSAQKHTVDFAAIMMKFNYQLKQLKRFPQ